MMLEAASEIERLRSHSPNPADHRYWEGRYRDEAAEVDRLKAEVERLRSALAAEREECAKVAEALDAYRNYIDASDEQVIELGKTRDNLLDKARDLDPFDGETPVAAAIRART